ncbi:YkgJ family cysteine cluster protein [Desulfofustis glycolicus]|uniref:Putative zinc-or iron-chelating domain-containing protein n=1 Tax=Desulfofustis glycolicus DSM 9705 TaxID=1121409 RepID=A0A1M5WPR3_9BACT|nr:YkgJ family cysteine cluster protein [Desulfofustis glycolicus]MCB2217011.1 YkgJ family cysteine cluster protein [Desulfobulbaceae bacterium]SHH89124.1 Putative zinc-or iron-chelating domain-containing protein [Desulfofustis glycolicus DSM 9705]
MTRHINLDSNALKTIFHECQQCGTCCKKYRKITLQAEEVDFIKKMGGHVGVDVSLAEIRTKGLARAREEALASGKIFMIHPDDKGCLFLQKRDGKYYCKIYNYRPRTCRGFKCNLADGTFLDLFGQDSIHLLGQNSFGLPLS